MIKSKHQMTIEEYNAWIDYMTETVNSFDKDCYACNTQRQDCEHTDWEEYQNGKSWEDEAPRKEEFEDGKIL